MTSSEVVVDALSQTGGIGSRAVLLTRVSRRQLDAAVTAGDVLRVARGRYALPTAAVAQKTARELTGVAILLSAAAHWEWETKWQPRRPQVAVPRGRNVSSACRKAVDVRWRDIPAAEVVDGWVSSPLRTVVDCAVLLPFDEALAVADSALRCGAVTVDQLAEAASTLPVQLRPRVRRVVDNADVGAANPFESVLRSIAILVPGLTVRTQVRIGDPDGFVGRVDLADTSLRIVLEAEGLEFHGEREQWDKDCARYSRLSADGWLVLRFTRYQVMTRPEWVGRVLERAVRSRSGGLEVPAEDKLLA